MRSWVWIFQKLETYFQNVSVGETEGYCLLTLPSTQHSVALSQSASKNRIGQEEKNYDNLIKIWILF